MNQNNHSNPFYTTYKSTYSSIPFDSIVIDDFEPAIMHGINEANKEINNIINSTDKPTFENTIERLERSGDLLSKVTDVFYNLLSVDTCNMMDDIAERISPILTEHYNDISLNMKLFMRVKSVYESAEGLNEEQLMLLNNCYDDFIRKGAALDDEKKKIYRKITSDLSLLSLKFSKNKLKDLNDYYLHLTSEEQLTGLPDAIRDLAFNNAKERGVDGWCITLHSICYIPFMTYSSNRELRKELYIAYNTICTHDNENNNLNIIREIVNLRHQLANLLGYKNYADFVLEKRMASNTESVYSLLHLLLDSYKGKAKEEVNAVIQMARNIEGDDFELMPWDFSYYSNKLKEKDFELNSEMLRPYFELNNVKKGLFKLATKLYGIEFKKNNDVPVYHKDVESYDIYDEDGSFLALLYCDYHPRHNKKSGAWMTSYREQYRDGDGCDFRPCVSLVTNVTKPSNNQPSLLTLEEVETLLHEFGHVLHGVFSDCTYKSLSGTNVLWDFVELPSQFMENYLIEKDFLKTFAFHYKTGEVIPDEYIERIRKSRNFNVAYSCLRQISFGLLDMAYYTIEDDLDGDLIEFEHKAWSDAQILPQIEGTCMSAQFSHIMDGGYSAGYYSYKWAEVLDADVFSVFQKEGIFNKDTARRFRRNILSKGGTQHPMDLYIKFKGEKPTVDALLKRNGIK